MTAPPENLPVVLEAAHLGLDTPTGRPLLSELQMSLGPEPVALIGRNGVGKSTLLTVLAGLDRPHRGTVVAHTARLLVPQVLPADPAPVLGRLAARGNLAAELAAAGLPADLAHAHARPLSLGERRRLHLLEARLTRPGLLLLDEPTADLDAAGVDWLLGWLGQRTGALLVASHHRRLLRRFEHFFVLEESGCRYFCGSLEALQQDLAQRDVDHGRRYRRQLAVLEEREEHHDRLRRRKHRKQNLGRLHEMKRLPCRAKLNAKRSYAQESQGRAARIRDARVVAVRDQTLTARRALAVRLDSRLEVPVLPGADGAPLVELRDVGVAHPDRALFAGITLTLGRERLAIVGPSGSGKTTLLDVLLGHRRPTSGTAQRQSRRIGSIAQGADDWRSEISLLELLGSQSRSATPGSLAQVLAAHRFPLALASRPLGSLSPGERTRAALIGLLQRVPAPELLVLDEPTSSLDLDGLAAVEQALRAWPGGLVVVSHDDEFLRAIGVERVLVLGHDGS